MDSTMNQEMMGYLLSICALLCSAINILITKKASKLMPLNQGFLVATFINVLFALVASVVQLSVQQEPMTWNTKAFAYFAGAGVFGTYLGRWFFYESIVLFGPAKASIFQVSNPLFAALIAWLFLGEVLNTYILLGILITVLGLIVVSTKNFVHRLPSSKSPPSAKYEIITDKLFANWILKFKTSILLLGLCGSLAYGFSNVLRGAAVREWNEPVLGGLFGASSGFLLHLLFTSKKLELYERLKISDKRGIWLFTLVGISTIFGQILTISAMRFLPVSIVTLVTLCTPLLVIPLSFLLFDDTERITKKFIFGAALTLAGVFIVLLS
jgi:drug/metabolite transporter (DMT)-like permease